MSFNLSPPAATRFASGAPETFQDPAATFTSQVQPPPSGLSPEILVRLNSCTRSGSANLPRTARLSRMQKEPRRILAVAYPLGRQIRCGVDVPGIQNRPSRRAWAQSEGHGGGEDDGRCVLFCARPELNPGGLVGARLSDGVVVVQRDPRVLARLGLRAARLSTTPRPPEQAERSGRARGGGGGRARRCRRWTCAT